MRFSRSVPSGSRDIRAFFTAAGDSTHGAGASNTKAAPSATHSAAASNTKAVPSATRSAAASDAKAVPSATRSAAASDAKAVPSATRSAAASNPTAAASASARASDRSASGVVDHSALSASASAASAPSASAARTSGHGGAVKRKSTSGTRVWAIGLAASSKSAPSASAPSASIAGPSANDINARKSSLKRPHESLEEDKDEEEDNDDDTFDEDNFNEAGLAGFSDDDDPDYYKPTLRGAGLGRGGPGQSRISGKRPEVARKRWISAEACFKDVDNGAEAFIKWKADMVSGLPLTQFARDKAVECHDVWVAKKLANPTKEKLAVVFVRENLRRNNKGTKPRRFLWTDDALCELSRYDLLLGSNKKAVWLAIKKHAEIAAVNAENALAVNVKTAKAAATAAEEAGWLAERGEPSIRGALTNKRVDILKWHARIKQRARENESATHESAMLPLDGPTISGAAINGSTIDGLTIDGLSHSSLKAAGLQLLAEFKYGPGYSTTATATASSTASSRPAAPAAAASSSALASSAAAGSTNAGGASAVPAFAFGTAFESAAPASSAFGPGSSATLSSATLATVSTIYDDELMYLAFGSDDDADEPLLSAPSLSAPRAGGGRATRAAFGSDDDNDDQPSFSTTTHTLGAAGASRPAFGSNDDVLPFSTASHAFGTARAARATIRAASGSNDHSVAAASSGASASRAPRAAPSTHRTRRSTAPIWVATSDCLCSDE